MQLTKLRFLDRSDPNSYYLTLEVIGASMFSMVSPFIATYALRFGATNHVIGLLSAIPALLTMIVTIPIGRLLQTRDNPLPWIIGGMVVYRMGFILFSIVPFLTNQFISSAIMIVIILSLINIPGQFYSVGFNVLMKQFVPERKRAVVFSNRNIISVVVSGVAVFIAGQWLNLVKFPINYQLLFLFSAFAMQLSWFFWNKVDKSKSVRNISNDKIPYSLFSITKLLKFVFQKSPNFGRLMRNTILLYVGLWIVAPLYVIFYVKGLGASDAWIGLSSMVASLSSLIGYILSRKYLDRFGEIKSLIVTAPFIGLFPFFVGLLSTLNAILFIISIYHVIFPFFALSHYNLVLRELPDDHEQDASAIWLTVMSIGSFLGPLLGVLLTNYFNIQSIMIFCGILAFLGSMSFWVLPIKSAEDVLTFN